MTRPSLRRLGPNDRCCLIQHYRMCLIFIERFDVQNAARRLKDHPLSTRICWSTVIQGLILVSTVERGFTRNLIWRSILLFTQVNLLSLQVEIDWVSKYRYCLSLLNEIFPFCVKNHQSFSLEKATNWLHSCSKIPVVTLVKKVLSSPFVIL